MFSLSAGQHNTEEPDMKFTVHYTLSGTSNYALLDQEELDILKGIEADSTELKITRVRVYRGRH
jgi:hypothetical protein